MNNSRFQETSESRHSISTPTREDPVLVVCPQCASKAKVIPLNDDEVRVSCLKCGFSTSKRATCRILFWRSENPTDGYFGLNLWLKTDFSGETLWAFNLKHLEFLESYVSAQLRTRIKNTETGWANSSLASRLPRWIKSSKNRESLLKAIRELRQKAL